MNLKPSEKAAIPVSEEVLERVRTGEPLEVVGRIDVRNSKDDLSPSEIAEVRAKHRQILPKGHKAPILLREKQMRSLMLASGFREDEKGDLRSIYDNKKADPVAEGSRFMGHELWVEEEA